MSTAGDYYRLWLRCRKQEIYGWGQAHLQKAMPENGPPETSHLGEIGPPRGSSSCPPKTGRAERCSDARGRGWSLSVGEKSPQPYRDQNKKKLFSQAPLPLNAKNCSYTDFPGKDQKVEEEHTWCLGVAFSGEDQEAVLPEAHVQLPLSPTSLFSPLPSFSPSQFSHILKWPQTGETSFCPSGHVTIILIQ